MKKVFSILALCAFAACGSDNTTSDAETKSAPVTPGIENVNGNIPDTTDALRLNSPLPTDSITKDSVRGPDSAARRR
jgi:hypothetical protein